MEEFSLPRRSRSGKCSVAKRFSVFGVPFSVLVPVRMLNTEIHFSD
jgi:hypothetical protein